MEGKACDGSKDPTEHCPTILRGLSSHKYRIDYADPTILWGPVGRYIRNISFVCSNHSKISS